MGAMVDLTGMKFGKLTAIEPTDKRNKSGNILWKCICDCGKTTFADAHSLKRGNTKTCGCSRKQPRPNRKKYGSIGINTRLYRIWSNMKTRCTNSHSQYKYSRYGGRGISVCEEWMNDFESFKNWAVSHGYSDSLTLDRIDNDGNYGPDNCRWATMSEQCFNRHKKEKSHEQQDTFQASDES